MRGFCENVLTFLAYTDIYILAFHFGSTLRPRREVHLRKKTEMRYVLALLCGTLVGIAVAPTSIAPVPLSMAVVAAFGVIDLIVNDKK